MSLEEIKSQAELVVVAIQKLIEERDSGTAAPAPEEIIYPSAEMLEGDVLWVE